VPSNPKAFPDVYSWKSKTEPHCGGLFDSTHHHPPPPPPPPPPPI